MSNYDLDRLILIINVHKGLLSCDGSRLIVLHLPVIHHSQIHHSHDIF